MSPLLYYTLRDLAHHKGRALLTLIGLAGVSFGYVILATLSESMFIFGGETRGTRNLVVIPNDVIDPMDGSVEEVVWAALEEVQPEMIAHASPMVFKHMTIDEVVMQLRAAPQSDWETVHGLSLIQGRWPDGEGEIVISEGATHFADWQLGRKLEIFGSEFLTTGVFQASGTKFASVWMTVSEAHRLFGPDIGYQLLFAQLAENADVDAVRAHLMADPRLAGRYDVYVEDKLNNQYVDVLRSGRHLAAIMTGLALLGITYGTYSATNMNLVERRRELGILRAIGFSASVEHAFLMLQVGLIGIVAYVLGASLAAVFVTAYQAERPVVVCPACLPMRVSAVTLLVGVVLVLVMAALGVWLSTRKSLMRSVAEILGHQAGVGGA